MKGANAIVTGSSRGIGRAIALELAGRGANIIVCCQSRVYDAVRVAREAEALGVRACAAQADLATEEVARRVVDLCLQELGKVDVLVNNSGMHQLTLIHSSEDTEPERMLRVNLFSLFYMCKYVVPNMTDEGTAGNIVSLSSILCEIGTAGGTAYAASKGGVAGFTVCLAREVARHGIRVNSVAPGYIDTEMTGWMTEEMRARLLPRIPLHRFGTAEEVAKTAAFLICDATYMAGQNLVMDGGILID